MVMTIIKQNKTDFLITNIYATKLNNWVKFELDGVCGSLLLFLALRPAEGIFLCIFPSWSRMLVGGFSLSSPPSLFSLSSLFSPNMKKEQKLPFFLHIKSQNPWEKLIRIWCGSQKWLLLLKSILFLCFVGFVLFY